jgi:hypothetical protein
MLNVVMLSTVIQYFTILDVFQLNVIMLCLVTPLSAIVLSVVMWGVVVT